MKVSAILVAAGKAARMGGIDKLSLSLGEYTVLQQSAKKLDDNALVTELIVVTRKEKIEEVRNALAAAGVRKLKAVVEGGETRFLSVQNGVAVCEKNAEYICIHDAARPFVSDALITKTIEAAFLHGAATNGNPVIDTIKRVDENGFTLETVDRSSLRAVATPQVFEAESYRLAAKAFPKEEAFDDCEVVEQSGKQVFVVGGEAENIKITTPDDLRRINTIKEGIQRMRIGHGYDVHKYVKNRELILGGVKIPFEMGLLGHSDADVLAHAVTDALLGAAALGDIGALFPDTDAQYKNADSLKLLKAATEKIRNAGFNVGNIDATILCERPKLREYIDEMRQNLARATGIDVSRVSVKATTEEGLGFTGEMRGVAAHAVALLSE